MEPTHAHAEPLEIPCNTRQALIIKASLDGGAHTRKLRTFRNPLGRAVFLSPKPYFCPPPSKKLFFFPLQAYFCSPIFYFALRTCYLSPKLYCSPHELFILPQRLLHESKCPRRFPPFPQCLLHESGRGDCVRRMQVQEIRPFIHKCRTSVCYTVFVTLLLNKSLDFDFPCNFGVLGRSFLLHELSLHFRPPNLG